MSEVMQAKVDAAYWKYLEGGELTAYEWRLLAYTVFSGGCASCGGRH